MKNIAINSHVKDILKLIVYVFVILIFYLFSKSTYHEKLKILEDGEIAIGQLVKKGRKSSGYFEYFVNGVKFSTRKKLIFPNTFVVGEKYEVKYLINNPNKCAVNLKKPIFDKSIFKKKESSSFSIITKDKEENFVRIKFFYKVNGVEYKRIQLFDYKGFRKYISEDKIKIAYSERNPQVSYIYLN